MKWKDNLPIVVGCHMLLIEENKYIKIYKRLRKPGKGKKNKSQARWKKWS